MDIERAFARRERLMQRLAVIETMDLTSDPDPQYPTICPGTVDNHHGVANTSGRCPYCGRSLGAKARPKRFPRRQVDLDIEDVIDPVTLEPVQACERQDAYEGLLRRRCLRSLVKVS